MIGTDYHIHTHYVGCANETMTIPAILARCRETGRTSIAITDHCDKDWQLEKNRLIRDELERTDPGGIEVFFGCEINIQNLDAEFTLDQDGKRRERFELVVAGVHSTWFEDGKATLPQIIERQNELMCKVASDPVVDVLVHPWWFPRAEIQSLLSAGFTSTSLIPDELTRELAKACLDHNTAVELNAAAILMNPVYPDSFKRSYKDYMARFVELGCLIALSSDAHDLRHLDGIVAGEAMLEEIRIPETQVWRPSTPAAVTGSSLNK